MRDVARRSDKDRHDLFREAASKMRVHEAIVEKDFWVCWVLDYLFHDSPWKSQMVFKGGTSLSKAYNAIERFSEDLDLILDWETLGYSKDEPWQNRTATKQDAFGKESNRRTADFLTRKFLPIVQQDLAQRLGFQIGVEAFEQEIHIKYPRGASLAAIQPQIKLEIGPMAAKVPNEDRIIRSYASEQFPEQFKQPGTVVKTLAAERTFWEKATILHQEAHRAADKPSPPRYSRHYYDLCRLSRLPVRDKALADMGLLKDVAEFKMRFYRCPWARYEDAKPGSLKLLPRQNQLEGLRRDYLSMQAMLFGEVPTFESIIEELANLEKAISAFSPK
jgi:hypothetical protein